jgi:hypothetical protein
MASSSEHAMALIAAENAERAGCHDAALSLNMILAGSEPTTTAVGDKCIFYPRNIDIPAFVVDYIYETFVLGSLFTEKYDTMHTDVCDTPHFFPEVYLLLKEMNPSMRMLHEARVESWGSRRGQTRYHVVFTWDSWSHWHVPKEMFPCIPSAPSIAPTPDEEVFFTEEDGPDDLYDRGVYPWSRGMLTHDKPK